MESRGGESRGGESRGRESRGSITCVDSSSQLSLKLTGHLVDFLLFSFNSCQLHVDVFINIIDLSTRSTNVEANPWIHPQKLAKATHPWIVSTSQLRVRQLLSYQFF